MTGRTQGVKIALNVRLASGSQSKLRLRRREQRAVRQAWAEDQHSESIGYTHGLDLNRLSLDGLLNLGGSLTDLGRLSDLLDGLALGGDSLLRGSLLLVEEVSEAGGETATGLDGLGSLLLGGRDGGVGCLGGLVDGVIGLGLELVGR